SRGLTQASLHVVLARAPRMIRSARAACPRFRFQRTPGVLVCRASAATRPCAPCRCTSRTCMGPVHRTSPSAGGRDMARASAHTLERIKARVERPSPSPSQAEDHAGTVVPLYNEHDLAHSLAPWANLAQREQQ